MTISSRAASKRDAVPKSERTPIERKQTAIVSERQNGAERLLSKHEFGLEKLNRRLVGAIFLSEFVVFLFLERFFNFCHLPLMPEDFIFEALNPFLQILGALQRPTLTTSDRDWINNSGNRFSARGQPECSECVPPKWSSLAGDKTFP